MYLQQIRKELQALREVIRPKDPWERIIMPPEVLRCSEELDIARERARQRLKNSGLPDSGFNECERMGFICDNQVIEADHNLLRAVWNAKNPDKEPIKIKFLFGANDVSITA